MKGRTRMREFLREKIRNDMEMGWIVPWHASPIYRAMHQTTPPFERNAFHRAKLMNQSNDPPK